MHATAVPEELVPLLERVVVRLQERDEGEVRLRAVLVGVGELGDRLDRARRREPEVVLPDVGIEVGV